MTPRHHLNDPWLILRTSIFRDFAHFLKSGPVSQWIHQDTDMGLAPSERALKIMGIHLRDHSFDQLGPEISWVKGGPGPHNGGWGHGQSGAPCLPGGECFAPFCALGALPLAEGGGAKHSPLTGEHGKMLQNHQKSIFLKIIKDHPRALRNTPRHV